MRTLRLSAPAEQDIEDILAHSETEFGRSARLRYETLIDVALNDILGDPDRPGVKLRKELGPGLRSYHFWHSRKRAAGRAGAVRRPRHLLVFRIVHDDIIEVGRVLHDAMELANHLPDEYRSGG